MPRDRNKQKNSSPFLLALLFFFGKFLIFIRGNFVRYCLSECLIGWLHRIHQNYCSVRTSLLHEIKEFVEEGFASNIIVQLVQLQKKKKKKNKKNISKLVITSSSS